MVGFSPGGRVCRTANEQQIVHFARATVKSTSVDFYVLESGHFFHSLTRCIRYAAKNAPKRINNLGRSISCFSTVFPQEH